MLTDLRNRLNHSAGGQSAGDAQAYPELAALLHERVCRLDGILTVNEVSAETFGVNIIDHTWKETVLGDRHW